MSDFERSIECDPEMVEALIEKSRILSSCGKLAPAIECITKAIEIDCLPEYLLERSSMHLEAGNANQAFADFSGYIAMLNTEERALFGKKKEEG